MKNFAAIDFETANGQRSSVCSVGVVVVRNGVVTDTFYSLIHPVPNYYARFCQEVHGLGPEDTDSAPSFPEVWEQIAPRIAGLTLVAHNSPFDEGCLKAVFQTYQMDYPDYRFRCTCRARAATSANNCPTTSCTRCRKRAASTWKTTTTPSPTPRPAPTSR